MGGNARASLEMLTCIDDFIPDAPACGFPKSPPSRLRLRLFPPSGMPSVICNVPSVRASRTQQTPIQPQTNTDPEADEVANGSPTGLVDEAERPWFLLQHLPPKYSLFPGLALQ